MPSRNSRKKEMYSRRRNSSRHVPDGSTTAHIYRPKIATVLAEGYNLGCFRRDMLAALIVAIVALPLSMAIAVASGVSPERGLYAAVIGGFLVSARGGSRYQIGGPAGAFIVLVASTVTKFGLESLDRERSFIQIKQSGSPKKVLATGRFWRKAAVHTQTASRD
jgi:MFS superfamily sulfate permease-like transporter